MSRSQDWFDQGNLASNNKIHKQEKSVGEKNRPRATERKVSLTKISGWKFYERQILLYREKCQKTSRGSQDRKLRRRMAKGCKDQTTDRGMTIQKSAQGKITWKIFLVAQTQ